MENVKILKWIEDLDHADRAVRRQAREQLLTQGIAVVEPLIAAMQSTTARKCYEAAFVLSQINDPRWLTPMTEALTSKNLMLGRAAVGALESQGKGAVVALIRALPGCHPFVQLKIACVLAKIGDRRAVSPLMQLLKTTDIVSVRYTVIEALGNLGDPRAIELIRFFQTDPDDHVRVRVQKALSQLEQPSRHSPDREFIC